MAGIAGAPYTGRMSLESGGTAPESGRGAGKPRPVTLEWMFRAAAHYLERYAASQEGLRRILERKVARRLAGAPDPVEAERFAEMIEATIARFVALGLLDDEAFAEARFASLRRRGASLRQAAARLGQKGVDRETIASVVGADTAGDLAAAHVHAKRRRLGPHRARHRAERRERDIAAMLRAGFGYADARMAIDAEPDGPAPEEA